MTSFEEDITMAFQNLKRRKLRSFLTILAIVVGMTAVVMFVTLGFGMQNAINEQFRSMGVDKIYITPSSSMFSFGGTTSKLTDHDKELIDRTIGVQRTAVMTYGLGRVAYKDEQKYTFIIGMLSEDYDLFSTAQGFHIEHGSLPRDSETDKVVVGWMFPQGKFFDKQIDVGKKLEIEGKIFEVAGTVSQIGNPSDDSQIYLPLEIAQDILDKKDSYDMIMAQSGAGTDTSAVAEKIKENMRRDRDLERGDEDFSVETSEELIKTFNSVLGILLIAVVGIASISLLVGGVGIMNTMYTSVLDRTQEIGILKAIGATDEDVMSVFVIESGLLGLIGGLIGVLLGTALSYVIQYIATVVLLTKLVQVYLDPLMLFGILAFSFIIGCISGLLPARRAAKMRPAEALRYE